MRTIGITYDEPKAEPVAVKPEAAQEPKAEKPKAKPAPKKGGKK